MSIASFRVDRVAELPARRVVILRGETLEGEVRQGMYLVIPWDEESDLVMEIDAVEKQGLAIRWANDLERVLWRQLDLRGRTLQVRATPHEEAE